MSGGWARVHTHGGVRIAAARAGAGQPERCMYMHLALDRPTTVTLYEWLQRGRRARPQQLCQAQRAAAAEHDQLQPRARLAAARRRGRGLRRGRRPQLRLRRADLHRARSARTRA